MPPFFAETEEKPIDISHESVRGLMKRFNDTFSNNIKIYDIKAHYSLKWGYVLRIIHRDIAADDSPEDRWIYMSWREDGHDRYILSPIDNEGDVVSINGI